MSYTTEQLQQLKAELTNDPLGVGYAGQPDPEIERLLELPNRSVPNVTEVPTYVLFGRFDQSEYATAIADTNKSRVLGHILSMGVVNPADNNLRDAIIFIFGAGSATVGNLAPLRSRPGTRLEELGLPNATVSDIANAKRLP